MHEVLLYGFIWTQSAIEFINAINEAPEGELTVRINSEGGDVNYGYGMIAKYREFEGTKKVKIDGQAASMAAFYLLYADDVEALDVSRIMFHRAGYSTWYEEQMPDATRAELIEMNSKLEAAFRAKVDVKKFEELKGIKVKDLFSLSDRKEVFLSASEAKQIGLVDRITKITPQKKMQINAEMQRAAASFSGIQTNSWFSENKPEATKQTINTNKTMTQEELQAQHPALYASVLNAGVQQGIEQERDRVGAWATFSEVDPKAVKDGIASGKAMNQTVMAELTVKMISGQKLKDLETETTAQPGANAAIDKPVDAEVKTPQAKFEDSVMAKLGIVEQAKA